MELAQATVQLDQWNNIVINGITPAEAALLRQEHTRLAGKDPVSDVVILGKALSLDVNGVPLADKRSDHEELQRLQAKFGKEKVEKAFPGVSPKLPENFSDVGYGKRPVEPAKQVAANINA